MLLDVLVIAAIYLIDIRNIGLAIFLLGVLLNAVIVIANKGYMPVLGLTPERTRYHMPMDDSTRLNFLGDIYLSQDLNYIFSIGDVYIVVGLNIWLCTAIIHSLFTLGYFIFTLN